MAEQIERLWGVTEVAQFLGLPVTTLYQWRHRNYGPPGRRIGRHIRYDPAAVRAWFEAQDNDRPAQH
jgi:excisionase family DNA binding protein